MAESKYNLTKQELLDEWEDVQLAQQNPQHFRVLYNRYYEAIFRFVLRRTASEGDSADICAQTFLKAMQNLKKYEHKGVPFSAWLFRIASNELAQFFRIQQKNRVVVVEEERIKDIEEDIGEDKEFIEMNLTQLKKVLSTLKSEEIVLVELRYFEQRPYKEISDIMGISEGTAKTRMNRLLKKMKNKFKELSMQLLILYAFFLYML